LGITVVNDHVIRVLTKAEKIPKELTHDGKTYVYGTTDGVEAVYYLKSWFYSE